LGVSPNQYGEWWHDLAPAVRGDAAFDGAESSVRACLWLERLMALLAGDTHALFFHETDLTSVTLGVGVARSRSGGGFVGYTCDVLRNPVSQ
jgi:hypothetical protein